MQGGYLEATSLGEVYGDLGPILFELIDQVERKWNSNTDYDEHTVSYFITKLLEVCVLILQEEKYRVLVRDTPALIGKIVGLLDVLNSLENKCSLLHVISLIGREEETTKEIGRLGGFKRMLGLMSEDKEIAHEVVTTLKYFLTEVSIDVDTESESEVNKLVESERPKKSNSGAVKKVGSGLVGLKNFLSPPPKETKIIAPQPEPNDLSSLIPMKEALLEAIKQIQQQSNALEGEKPESDKIAILKDYMTQQGCLPVLIHSLKRVNTAVQLEIFETIAKILYNNQKCQAEFCNIDGYSQLLTIFDKVPKLSAEDCHLFLQQLFKIFFAMCLDGKKGRRIGNMDAFRTLFNVVVLSGQDVVQRGALHCIQNLIGANVLNIANIYAIDGIGTLLRVLKRDKERPTPRVLATQRETLTLIRYIAVLGSQLNIDGLNGHFNILKDVHNDLTRIAVLNSMVALLTDHIYRKNNLVTGENFTHITNNLFGVLVWMIDSIKSAYEALLQSEEGEGPEKGENIMSLLQAETINSQKLMLILRSIGTLICSSPTYCGAHPQQNEIPALSMLFQTCSADIEISEVVMELALWIIKELIVVSSRHTKKLYPLHSWMLEMLDFSTCRFSSATKSHLCHTAAELLQDIRLDPILGADEFSDWVLDRLVVILKTEKDLTVRSAAWYAFGRIVSTSEHSKQFVGSRISYDQLTEVVNKSGVVVDRASFDVLLEISCYGLEEGIGSVPHSNMVQDVIGAIKYPRPGIISKGSALSQITSTTSFDRTESVSDEDFPELKSTGLSFEPKFRRNLSPSFSFLKSRSVDSLVSVFEDVVGASNHTTLTPESQYPDLIKVQFRSSHLTPVLLGVLRSAPLQLQQEALKLLLVLCNSNSTNTKILARGSGLVRTLEMVKAGVGPEVQAYYYQFMATLGLYDITQDESKMLFDILQGQPTEMSTQLLLVLSNISERTAPLSYLSFTGLSGYFRLGKLDRFPTYKTGYTLSCWIKLNAFLSSEYGLLAWSNFSNDETIFELYFKTTPNLKGRSGSGSRAGADHKVCILCAYSKSADATVADSFSFSEYQFREWDSWRHIVFTHSHKQATLYIDGVAIQSTPLAYPRAVTKENPLAGYVGRRGANRLACYCGQIGPISFTPGVWDAESVSKVYQRGEQYNPLSFETEISVSEQQKPFLCVRPEDYIIQETHRDHSVINKTSSENLVRQHVGSIQDHVFPPNVVAHSTQVLKNAIQGVGGIAQVLSWIDTFNQQQVAVLHILVNLLYKSPENMLEFLKIDGFTLLYHKLRANHHSITVGSFNCLFYFLCNALQPQRKPNEEPKAFSTVTFKHYEVLLMIYYLSMQCCDVLCTPPTFTSLRDQRKDQRTRELMGEAAKYVFETLEDILAKNRANAQFLLKHPADSTKPHPFLVLLCVTSHCSIADLSVRPLKRVFQILLPYFDNAHMLILMNFLMGAQYTQFLPPEYPASKRNAAAERFEYVKLALLQVLYDQMLMSPQTIEQLRTFGSGHGCSFRALMTLLKSPVEGVRILALRMIGVLLHFSKQSSAYFLKNSGFDMVSLLLAPFPVSLITLQTLLGLAQDEFRCKVPIPVRSSSGIFGLFADSDPDPLAGTDNLPAISAVESASPESILPSHPDHVEGQNSKGEKHSGSGSTSTAPPPESPKPAAPPAKPGANDKKAAIIIYPEALHALFEVIKFASDESLKTATLRNFSEVLLVHPENIEMIWTRCSWLEWCLSFLDTRIEKLSQRLSYTNDTNEQHEPQTPQKSVPTLLVNSHPSSPVPKRALSASHGSSQGGSKSGSEKEDESQREHSHNTLRQLGVFIRKMMVYELEKKTTRFDLLQSLEHEQFQGHVIELVIVYYENCPKISSSNASTIISNLVSLFKHIKMLNIHPRVYIAMLDVIAKFTVHNTAEVRNIMHKENLFEFRNDLICYLLQSSRTKPEAASCLLHNFEFQSIAAHEGFREAHGIHFLLRIFHECSGDVAYQKIVYRVLKKVFGGMEHNKIFLKDFFVECSGDEEVFKYFFLKSRGTFVQWYFNPNGAGKQYREQIEKSLEKILGPLDQKLKNIEEKVGNEQLNRQKKLKARSKSNPKWSNFAELEQKRKADESMSISTTQTLLTIITNEKWKGHQNIQNQQQ